MVSRDFDGHQAWPLLRMTPAQRLTWAWEMLMIQRDARQRLSTAERVAEAQEQRPV